MLGGSKQVGPGHGLSEKAELTIVIVLYRSSDGIASCLRSLSAELAAIDGRIIAVDNASPDDDAAIVRREMPAATIILLEENVGFAGGANAALANASGRYVALLNPDVVVPPGGLTTMIAWMDAHPDVGVATPELVDAHGHRTAIGHAFPSAGNALLELSRLHRLLPREVRSRRLRGFYWSGGEQLDAGWVPGAAMFIRTDAMREVGSLNQGFFMYGEDIEWCWRFHSEGWKIGVCADVAFQHSEGESANSVWGADERAERIAGGMIRACAVTRGRVHGIAYALIMAAALAVEAVHPKRSTDQRIRTRAWLRAWCHAILPAMAKRQYK